ncbi:unnamed protein product [Kuraishia capsulata CBS 1993]|uniref:STAS domain-containing protein n=1 Tax=Kuraishia capsulata CBS 1993 TaxID=1382522 RepID=W6MTC0_9ASCO|nr:uncharacterized protein KUCA_T00006061001 [Kuraishia capsulata CBS 1993]CDK30066.1 unnamed protein product [Kuraishia capsulata CBS 1993]
MATSTRENEITFHDEDHSSVALQRYHEDVADARDYGTSLVENPLQKTKDYLWSLFPITNWILHYNRVWLYGDLVAGITVGTVLVPQSMSYAQVAGLDPEYGLYSSFIGVFIYCFFATSKDVSIGPVAVMSMQVGKIIARVQDKNPEYPAPVIATVLSLICGSIAFGLGLLRLGFILEFISIPAVMGFMTGSAFSIIVGQVPGLMGYNKLVNTRNASYRVVIDTLKNLPHTKVDAAFGLICLFILYFWRWGCDFGARRYPQRKKFFFYTLVLRNAVVLVFSTLISWGAIYHYRKVHPDWKTNPFSIIGTVPSGLKHVGVMKVPPGIVKEMASEIPVSTIVLLLEHISISKSFGRVNDYKIVPDQELIAIGFTNLIGTFFNAYPATGSFSRSALKSKCGVRTPLAGISTGVCVLLALYCLTKAFYYIPKAVLSSVIIHAVSDLITDYQTTFSFWKIAPFDAGIFLIAVIITVFASIEDGIYFAICASAAILLWRLCTPNGVFLGRVKVAHITNPVIVGSDDSDDSVDQVSVIDVESIEGKKGKGDDTERRSFAPLPENVEFSTRWVPLSHKKSPYSSSDIHVQRVNPKLNVLPPPPGVIVFRPSESFIYTNCSKQFDTVLDEVKRVTRPGHSRVYKTKGDRPWNDPGELDWSWAKVKDLFTLSHWIPKRGSDIDDDDAYVEENRDPRPLLRIVHFDFASVIATDATSIQSLVDLRNTIHRYVGNEVEFHFSGILNPWIRRSLLAVGFGKFRDETTAAPETLYFDIGKAYSSGNLETSKSKVVDEEEILTVDPRSSLSSVDQDSYYALTATDTPFFHLDIPSYEHLE